LSIKG